MRHAPELGETLLDYREMLEEFIDEEPISEIFPVLIGLSDAKDLRAEFPGLIDGEVIPRVRRMDQQAEFSLFTRALEYIVEDSTDDSPCRGWVTEVAMETIEAFAKVKREFDRDNQAKVKRYLKAIKKKLLIR